MQQPYLASLFLPWAKAPVWQGMFWKLSSCFAFACMNNIVRYLSGGSSAYISIPLPIFTIIFFQNILSAIFSIILLSFNKKNINIFTTKHISLHLFRIIFAVSGIVFWYLTLKYFPIAHSVALSFLGPIFTLLAAVIFLKEKLDISRALAITISFIAAFLILNDKYILTGNKFQLAILFPIAAATCFVVNKITTRKLALNGESAEKLTIYLLIFMAPISGILALINWQTPSLVHIPWLLLIGLLAVYAYFSFNKAYTLADVTHLMPLSFTKFILNTTIGYFAFAELANSVNLWLGLAMICLSLFILGLGTPNKE